MLSSFRPGLVTWRAVRASCDLDLPACTLNASLRSKSQLPPAVARRWIGFSKRMRAPVAERVAFVRKSPFGLPSRVDDYAWLEDKDRAKVLSHLTVENKYTDHVRVGYNRSDLTSQLIARCKRVLRM